MNEIISRETPGSDYGRSACTECQRRKQKCDRQWPCEHCRKRKVADKCSFRPLKASPTIEDGRESNRKRRASQHDANETEPPPGDEGVGETGEGPSFETIGYMTTTLFANLGLESKKDNPISRQYFTDSESCPQLKHALAVLPTRPMMDALIENFLQTVNYHYYIIYPRVFLEEYQDWWKRYREGNTLGLQYTCLLLMICACTMQHLDAGTRHMLELDWGDTAQNLTEQYHTAGRELGSVVPAGYYHVYHVQQLLHSCYWYKGEAKFLECWHVLSTAVREAQELGFHKEASVSAFPDFDREMSKRIWCIINCWDWQVSSGLIRPTIIDRTDCDVGLPALSLESYYPSPLLYMKMQAELIEKLATRFTVPKNVVEPQDVEEYRLMIENWMNDYPTIFAFENPDRSLDKEHPWICFHRYYLYTMAYLMILNPIRAYMAETVTHDSSQGQVDIRNQGVQYSLRLIQVLREWLDIISHRDGRFHFIIFALLDTSLSLSNAVIHDRDNTLPKRNEVLDAIDTALSMLKRLKMMSPTAKQSHDILNKLVKKIPRPGSKPGKMGRRKKAKVKSGHVNGTTDPSIAEKESDLPNELMNLFEGGGSGSGAGGGGGGGFDGGMGDVPSGASFSSNYDMPANGFTSGSSYSNEYGHHIPTSSSVSGSAPPSVNGNIAAPVPVAAAAPVQVLGVNNIPQPAMAYTTIHPVQPSAGELLQHVGVGYQGMSQGMMQPPPQPMAPNGHMGTYDPNWDWQQAPDLHFGYHQ